MVDQNANFHDSAFLKMLEDRQQYARNQKTDYSHVFRKKSATEIVRLSALAIGIGLVYAAETAFVCPTLLQIGVEHSAMTMVWGLSPVLGLFLGPILGSISDRCRLTLGRRRPMILILSLGMVLGFIVLPFGKNIGQFFGDDDVSQITSVFNSTMTMPLPSASDKPPNLKIAIALTIIGVVLTDFSAETCQNPIRAYMLDVCIPEDHNRVLSAFGVMTGLGSTIAYAIGGIDWESTALGRFFGGNIQTSFVIDGICFIVCFFVTFLSFKEIPLNLLEKDKLLQPLVAPGTKTQIVSNNNNNHQESFYEKELRYEKEKLTMLPELYAEAETVSLRTYLKSIVVMPKSMWILSLTNLLCWMGQMCYCIYFTDYVGEEVFKGKPTAPLSSEEYKLYDEGVRFGGLGLAVYAMACSIYSLFIEKLITRFTSRGVYVFGILVFTVGMVVLAVWPSKVGVILLSITSGINVSTLYTIPFIIVANYHAVGCFEVRNGKQIPMTDSRGIGTDLAIVGSMLFIGQLLVSLSIGFTVTWMGTTSAILYYASLVSFGAAVSAMFVLYI